MTYRIGLVGLGKIARDQHLPTIAASPEFELVAVTTPNGTWEDGPTCRSVGEMLAGGHALDAVVLCTPPQARFDAAWAALDAGLHVFLEKPPGATLSEVDALARLADARRVTLFAGWHSRAAAGVEPARAWLADRTLRSVTITWREDAHVWHPGQAWLWQPGGMGVFDPGINALSIATAILPRPFHLQHARMEFPSNCQAPIAARLSFTDQTGVSISADLDFRQEGPQTWDIRVEADGGPLVLHHGGAVLEIAGTVQPLPERSEYAGLYAHFATLIASERSDADVSPLRHVADAFMLGERVSVAPFTP